MVQTNKAVEEREVIGELSAEHIKMFEDLNIENNIAHQAVNDAVNALTENHEKRIAAIQARGRAIWDIIGQEYKIDVINEVFKAEKNSETGVTQLFKIVRK